MIRAIGASWAIGPVHGVWLVGTRGKLEIVRQTESVAHPNYVTKRKTLIRCNSRLMTNFCAKALARVT